MLAVVGRNVPGRLPLPLAGENPGSRRQWAAPDPGLHRWCGRFGAGFELEGGHLVLLVANAQREVMQGAAKGGVGATGAAARGHPASRTPLVRGRGHQAAAVEGGGGVVSCERVFGSTQCLRKLFKKIF